MKKSKFYHQYTDFNKEPGGLRKLDFIVETLERNFPCQLKFEIKILDVGCGNGNISLPLASLGYHILGIDSDAVSVENVQQKNKFANAKFLVFEGEKINSPPFQKRELEKDFISPFPLQKGKLKGNLKFDCVIASEFFEHLENPQNFAKQVFQVLSPCGILIASIPNGGSLVENFRWFLNQTSFGRAVKKILRKTILKKETIQSYAESPHVQFFSLRGFKKILRNAGFEIQKIKNSSAIFGEIFYLFWRFFLKRGSRFFNFLDTLDNKLTDFIPKWLSVGWIIISKKSKK